MGIPIQGLDVLYSEFRGSSVNQVPVLRLFGSVPTGEKICVHIHGVFPYIYIPYDGVQDANMFMYKIASSIDKAVNISLNQASSNMQHVYKITLVSGIPMYGYHTKGHQFFKIYLYNPLLVRKVTGLLMNASTLGSQYQPHEAHLSFTLQFMIDYNLHGMSNLLLSKIKYRRDSNNMNEINADSELFLPVSVNKSSICQLEGDCLAEDIINRLEVASGNIGANPGIAALWEDEKQRRRNKGMTSQLGHLLELSRIDVSPTKSHMIYKQALEDRLAVFSNEKNFVDKLNASVYPAETPDSTTIRNASLVDSQTSCDSISDLDETVVPAETSVLNLSMDQDAQQLFKILNELEENVKEIEEDSILIQVSKHNDQDIDENEFDFSLSLESVQTPVKMIPERDESDDDLLNTTLIPQVDGGFDEDSKEVSSELTQIPKPKWLRKLLYVKLIKTGKDMPSLEDDFNIRTNFNKNNDGFIEMNKNNGEKINKKRRKLTRKQRVHLRTNFEVKSFKFGIKAMKRRDQLAGIMRKLHEKRNEIILFIIRSRRAKFRIISKNDVKELLPIKSVDVNKTSKVNIISDIIVKIGHYVDPSWHLTIKYPNHCCFLYDYRSGYLPEITRIPRKICCSNRKTNIEGFVKKQMGNRVDFNGKKSTAIDLDDGCRQTKRDTCMSLKYEEGKQNTKSIRKEILENKLGDESGGDFISMTEKLRKQLEIHIRVLKSRTNLKINDEYSNADHRSQILDKLTCFKSQDEFLDQKSEENTNVNDYLIIDNNINDKCKEESVKYEVGSQSKECSSRNRNDDTKCSRKRKNNVRAVSRRSKRLKRCIYEGSLSLDGNVDSDSSEEELLMHKQERSRTPRRKSKYNALPISLQKSQKSPKCSKSSETGVNNDLVSTRKTTENLNQVVRQLFNKHSFQNKTITEEKLICRYESINDRNYITDTSNSSAVFSSDSDNPEITFPNTKSLTIAEKYDKETSYEPKEGCSKILTPQSDTVVTESSNSDYLTPYQHPNLYREGVITIKPKLTAPTVKYISESIDLNRVLYQEPFCSNLEDLTGNVEVGFNVLKVNTNTTMHLQEFDSTINSLNVIRKNKLEEMNLGRINTNSVILSYCKNRDCVITPLKPPPTLQSIENWIEEKKKPVNTPEIRREKIVVRLPASPGGEDDDLELSLTPNSTQTTTKSSESPIPSPTFRESFKKRKRQMRFKKIASQESSIQNSGQISGLTVNISMDKSAENLKTARAIIEHQNLTILAVELHVHTRSDMKPDPKFDSIRAIFYSILNDVPEPNLKGRHRNGIITVNVPILNGLNCDIISVDSEEELIKEFLKLVVYWDPDIFAGYEIELLSWGYLIERGYVLNTDIKPLLSRTKDDRRTRRDDDDSTDLKLAGRIVLDVWRLMRHEISLQSYTFESVAYHLLRKRFAKYSFKDLSFWWEHRTHLYRHRTVKYYLTRVVTILELFDKLDFLGRTSELARLFGIQFFEVLSRGTQFRVESMMLRLAKPLNFIPVSPSVQQRAHMKAPEYIPLVMEPESKLYNDPVIVLDFQSLYPSIIIAYNYCFTTCIGRIECLGKNGPFEFGATQLRVSRNRLRKLLDRNQLNFSPCGVGFVKKEVRDGVLPRMLREILDTRLMVKNSMKENPNDKILQKALHNRQLGLKLIANVTYGYTSANFSGRMPSVEVGDSVVSKGRETLQRAIQTVDNTPEWGARVVYGDTDSLFVLVPGRTKEQAFKIGQEIAETVTNDNPDPIKLKLEKVYLPCILQTKKRYVGYMYESPEQKEPVYQAKGIETVRRDGCPAVSKMLEKCLRILFETKDVSLVKKYVLKQFDKIVAGRVSIQDLTFAKEYRGASGYRPGACVPALELTKKWTSVDPRNEPRSGERVPYVIVNGPPGLPLIRLVKSPRDLIEDSSLKPNVEYYITRVIIPPLNRCFTLLGVDISIWYKQMPRKKVQYLPGSVSPKKKSTISQYFSTSSCISCEEQTRKGICEKCIDRPQSTVVTLMEKMRKWERNYLNIKMVCQTCTSSVTDIKCVSLDCPTYYRRIQTIRDEQQTSYIRQLLDSSDLSF
ncbi:DNA polymerase zeta catalytic subunit isoform X2 [Diorhabda carinulata]|nr:DNA polymerase zeta catalytic subunit isoform X2 [Diorhabda carinulata]